MERTPPPTKRYGPKHWISPISHEISVKDRLFAIDQKEYKFGRFTLEIEKSLDTCASKKN